MLVSSLREAGGQLRIRNALNPILWLCGVVAVPCIAALCWSKDAPVAISVVLYSVVAVALVGFLYLLFRDPDRLQSEEYLLRSRTLDLIEEKGSKKALDAATVKLVSRMDFLAMPDGGEDRK